jgi:hypothetical protein
MDGQDRRYSAVLKGHVSCWVKLVFSLRAFTATQEKFQNKNPDSALPPTQIIERIQRRTNLLTDFGFRIDVLKSVNQRGIFGTQLFSQFVHSLKQLIEFLGISLLVSLHHLVTELGHIAIDSRLGFVAADYFEDLLRVLSLRTYWRGGDDQNGNHQPQVHVMPPAMMMMPNPKKVTK